MLLKQILLGLLGLAGGFSVAGGIYALLIGLGIVTRYAAITHTAHNLHIYEDCVFWGALFGNTLFLYKITVPFGEIFLWIMGLSFGIFLGGWIIALAEIVNVFPIFARRIKLTKGAAIIIISMAISKVIGSLIYFIYGF